MNVKRTLTILSLSALILIVVLAIAGYFLLKNFNLNDGPFHGESRESCDLENPNSTLELTEDIRLESFSRAENEKAATVRLIKNNKIEWCIYAQAFDHSYVHNIEFKTVSRESYANMTVYGSVYWTYGNEATIWHIKNNGELIEYWYSW